MSDDEFASKVAKLILSFGGMALVLVAAYQLGGKYALILAIGLVLRDKI